MENNILNLIIGKRIVEIRIMSFYLNKKNICDIVAFYVRIDTDLWYKFTTSDGYNFITLEKEEPLEIMLDEFEDEFAYPVKKINLHYINQQILGIKEYQYKNYPNELNGFYIRLDKGGISLFEEDDCLKIYDGIISHDDYLLV